MRPFPLHAPPSQLPMFYYYYSPEAAVAAGKIRDPSACDGLSDLLEECGRRRAVGVSIL